MPGTRRSTGVYVGPVEGPRGRKYRVRVRNAAGESRNPSFDSREEAEEFRKSALAELELERAIARAEDLDRQAKEAWAFVASLENRSLTVREVLEKYEEALTDRGLKPISVSTKLAKIRNLCDTIMDMPLSAITPAQTSSLYRARTKAMVRRGRTCKLTPIAAATHRGDLDQTQQFSKWAAEAKLAHSDPWAGVKPTGRANEGKDQLSAEESLKLHDTLCSALVHADLSVVRRALAAAMALYLGFRAHEIVGLPVRFVFSDGSHVDIRKSKTRAGKRASMIPDELPELRSALARVRADAIARAAADGRDPLVERLLPYRRNWVREQAHRFCRDAGVPLVCAHALRGMQSTLATEGGETAAAVAAALGQTSERIAKKHYIDPATLHSAQAARVARNLRVYDGGKKR